MLQLQIFTLRHLICIHKSQIMDDNINALFLIQHQWVSLGDVLVPQLVLLAVADVGEQLSQLCC